MENPTVSGLRSRSRSKTPFLRSSCDHENCNEGDEDHSHHKTGRKTPIKRSTPTKQLKESTTKITETIREVIQEDVMPVHRTRQSTRATAEKLVKTSDYSSEESLDRLKERSKEMFQNEINSQYEQRVSTSSQRYGTLADLTFSPIHSSYNVTKDRSYRIGSPAYSACSTDSSFAEQALADTSALLDRNPNSDHLPSRLYKMAGEYWNKYPKTDYTYSPMSRDRVELAPGQVAMPNMSRRSLSQFRVQGPLTSRDEIDRLAATTAWTTTTSKLFTSIDGSDDETYLHNGGAPPAEERWALTRALLALRGAAGRLRRRLVGPAHRYPYTDRRPREASVVKRAAAATVAPFYWVYMIMKQVVTTTITTVTETITTKDVGASEKRSSRQRQRASPRRWWPWLLLLLLPVLGYGSHYTYEHWEHLAMPNFTDFQLDLSEYTPSLQTLSLPNITMLSLPTINLAMPEINITLPDIRDNLPEVSKTYREYKDIVQDRIADASDYVSVVAESCYEELKRYWRSVLG